MINRILIRNKVVQLLYSYLLTKSEFEIESEPDTSSKVRRFAYEVYIDTFDLLFRLTGLKKCTNTDKTFKTLSLDQKDTLLLRSLFNEEKLKIALEKKGNRSANLSVLEKLQSEIANSSLYRSFVRTKEITRERERDFWIAIIEEIISKNPDYIAESRKNNDFTIAGFERGIRNTIETFKSYNENKFSVYEAERELNKSLDKAYELYKALLLLPIEITKLRAQQIDAGKHKLLPTSSDLNPNTKFIDNCLPKLLRRSVEIDEFIKNEKGFWVNDQDLIKRLLDLVVQSDVYNEYINSENSSRESDCNLWKLLMKNVILPSDDLAEVLESKSVYWNDDLEIIGTFVVKTIKMAGKTASEDIEILPKYKDSEDEEFGITLFRETSQNYKEYKNLIQKFINVSSWDPERIAFMDIVILATAISEILHFPKIALPITINEYIEIANSYSTSRSGQFINGVLFSVTNYLREEGKLIGK